MTPLGSNDKTPCVDSFGITFVGRRVTTTPKRNWGWHPRPDLFVYPTLGTENKDSFDESQFPILFSPLAGHDLYVTSDDFKSYVFAIREFWNQLADELESMGCA